MHNKFLLFCLLSSLFLSLPANNSDSLRLFMQPAPQVKETKIEWNNYLQYGFYVGTDIPLNTRQLSASDHLNGLMTGMFGFYVRSGYRFIFGELGLNYMFHKGRYEASDAADNIIGTETVESRYLQIPVKAVGNLRLGKFCYLLPNTGFIYQPLIHCTSNDIGYGKNNLTRHQFLYHAGIAFRIKFFTAEIACQKALRPFYSDRPSIKPFYLSLMLGVKL